MAFDIFLATDETVLMKHTGNEASVEIPERIETTVRQIILRDP